MSNSDPVDETLPVTGCCVEIHLGLEVAEKLVSGKLARSVPSNNNVCSSSSTLTNKLFISKQNVLVQTQSTRQPPALNESLMKDPELKDMLDIIKAGGEDVFQQYYEDKDKMDWLGKKLMATRVEQQPSSDPQVPLPKRVCEGVLDHLSLLYELGALVQAAIARFRVTDDGWQEAIYLTEHPKEVGAPLELHGANQNQIRVRACPLFKDLPYNSMPSDFLRWFACQKLKAENLGEIGIKMGMRARKDKHKSRIKVLIRLKRQVSDSILSHLSWSAMLAEQAIRDSPGSPLARTAVLEKLQQYTSAFLFTMNTLVSPYFKKGSAELWEQEKNSTEYRSMEEWKEARMCNALAYLQTSRWREGFTSFTKYLANSRHLLGAANALYTAVPGPPSVNNNTAVAEIPVDPGAHNALATIPVVPGVHNAVAEIPVDPAGAHNALPSKVEHVLGELFEQLRPTWDADTAHAVSNVTVPADREPPAESAGGASMGALMSDVKKNLKASTPTKDQVPERTEVATLEKPTCGWFVSDSCTTAPGGYTDLVPAVVGQHALVSAGFLRSGWSPFAEVISTADSHIALPHKKCDGLLKAFKGAVSSKTFQGHYTDEEGKPADSTKKYPEELRGGPEGAKKHTAFLLPTSDHNGAFALNDQLCEWFACWAGKGFGVFIKSISSPAEAIQALKRFGKGVLQHVVLGGHGAPFEMGWGDGDLDGLHKNAQATQQVLAELQEKLSPSGSLVLDACETGKGSELRPEGQIAEHLKAGTLKPKNLFEHVKLQMGDRKVYAPTRSYSVDDYAASADFESGHCTPDARKHTWTNSSGETGFVTSALDLGLVYMANGSASIGSA